MALSNEQLLMLDNLIYTDYCHNGDTVEKIIKKISNDLNNGKSVEGCRMTKEEWCALIKVIENEHALLDYKVQNYENDPRTGMRVSCFVDDVDNPMDVTIVFRGTSGDYEWHDNGEGAYCSDTAQQKLAAEYVNNLPAEYGKNMTVTGHSKGGNKAQYVTIVTNRIDKCVSYDGQGFSQEFIEKYKEQISTKAKRIVSISASNDYVNCLLYPIAGTRKYVETEEQKDFLNYHKPNILIDENGRLRKSTEQSLFSRFIMEYTTYMISNLDEPERSITVDGLIALLEKGDKESIVQSIYASGNALSYLDDFMFNYIGEKYGLSVELIITYLAVLACPYLFIDDFARAGKKVLDDIENRVWNYVDEVAKKLKGFGQKATEYANKFKSAMVKFINNIKNLYNRNFNTGYMYASANPQIGLDTCNLRYYAQRIQSVNYRISNLDSRLDSLYWKVGLLDLWNLLQADILVNYSWRLSRCVSYLNETANDFDAVESNLINAL